MPEEKLRKTAKFGRSGCISVAQEATAGLLTGNQQGTRRPARRFNFTQKSLDSLPVPASGSQRVYYYDIQCPALAVACSPGGRMAFCVVKKVVGKTERLQIGPYRSTRKQGQPELSVGYARHKAEELIGKIAKGENPNDAKRALRDEPTLAELFEAYMTKYATPHLKPKTVGNYRSMFSNHLARWGGKQLSEIRKDDVVSLHLKIGKTAGKYVANRAIEVMCAAFNWLTSLGEWKGGNPAAGVKAYREKKRKRFLQAEELAPFFQSLRDEPNTDMRDFFLLDLCTGVRKSNLMAMQWPELNLDDALWTIPETKNGEALEVTLHPAAVFILRQRQQNANGSSFVFPGHGKSGHIAEVKSPWKRIITRAGLSDCRPHDVRRSLGSYLAIRGESLILIGAVLGQESAEATKIYAQLSTEPKRRAVNGALDYMFEVGNAQKLLGLPSADAPKRRKGRR
jgi:integrase